MLERYQRQIAIPGWGESGQKKLSDAHVMVIGAGGLGFPVLSYLAAAGIGNLYIVESDTVNESNLNRQLFYSESDIGRSKLEIAVNKLSSVNPHIRLIPVHERFTEHTADRFLKDIDVLVDCVDNYDTRVIMARVAHRFGKPMVHGAVSDFLGTVAVFDSRKGPCYQCLFTEKPEPGLIPVFGGLPGMVGTIQAIETIKLLTGIGKVQHDKVMLIDMESNRIYFAGIEKRNNCETCG